MSPESIFDVICLPGLSDLKQIYTDDSTNFMVLTGHLGNFEYLSHFHALSGMTMHYIVRDFKNRFVEKWWREIRERSGNTVISRRGALKKLLKAIRDGSNIGLLFDQNVTRNHAVFVDFFGRPAATTKTVGLLALRLNLPIYLFATIRQPDGKYRIEWDRF